MTRSRSVVLTLVVAACHSAGDPTPSAVRTGAGPLTPVPFDLVAIEDGFWRPKIETNRRVTVAACLDQCEATGRLANFRRCAKLEAGGHQGALYNDSDVYKVLEGAAYTLKTSPDAALEARVDAVIETIAAAQQPDGYLNTYWTMVKPAERWQHIDHGHELYCAGHLIEAAIAHFHATGKRQLLDVALRLADHIDREFGPGKRLDPTGHPELELALIKLWRETNEERYLALARFLVDQRGRPAGRAKLFGEYAQDHVPVREQHQIVGHAVRAMYLYCSMTDLAGVSGDESLWRALGALWHDVVDTKMYVTGGIGNSAANEGFTTAYDLPNDTAYCETCAAIGMALWNQRMFLATGDAKYAEIVERELYNGFLAGVSLGGDRFFYDNPLASRGNHRRVPWFDCSCCPTNVVRFLPAIGERIYAHRGDELYVSSYVASSATVPLHGGTVRVKQETEYPWNGDIVLHVDPERPLDFDLRLRVPDWAEGRARVAVAGAVADPGSPPLVRGFLSIRRQWRPGDKVHLQLPLEPRRVHSDPRVQGNVGRVALMRGPLVYCAEGIDHGGFARNLVLPPAAAVHAERNAAKLGGLVELHANGMALRGNRRALLEPCAITAVPYFAWAGRGADEMVVWLPESAALAELPREGDSLLQHGARISASHCWRGDTLAALNDGVLPRTSNDHDVPRHTFWDHRGAEEWLQYEFASARSFSHVGVYWFDDTGRGACRVPRAWNVAVRNAGEWRHVVPLANESFGTARDALQRVRFAPQTGDAIRLEVELQPRESAGVLEWIVE